jgi:OFA family oxalate/formate antiporter-like MFS transporter
MNRWRPIIGGVCLNLAFGSLYAWSVFVLPLEKEFGWTRAQTSWVYTIAIAMTITGTVIGGRVQDRRGPRVSALFGGALLACGYLLSSTISSLLTLYIAFGVVAGFGGGFGYAAPMPVASKWFPDRRGLVVGLMAGGYAAGSALVGPLATALMQHYGWRTTFRALGVLFFVMTMVGGSLLEDPPAGYALEGGAPHQAKRARTAPVSTAAMLGSPGFWPLWVAFCLGTMSGQMVISQLVPFARSAGLGVLAASLAIPIAALGNVSGRIISGGLSDRIGRLTTLRIMILASAILMPALYLWRQQSIPFFLLVAGVYWCYGAQLSVFASTTADFYGTEHLGLNWGVLMTAWGVAGIVAPLMAGWVFDQFQSYRYAFLAAAGLALVSIGFLTLVRAPSTQQRTTPSRLAS